MEDESGAAAPNETHPLLPLQGDAHVVAISSANGSSETRVQVPPEDSITSPTSDEDVTDECCRRSTPPCDDEVGVVSTQPKSGGESEYKAIIDMLKDAEKAANDPEYEEKVYARKFGAIKYNPRNQESSFGAVDYLCTLFQCCAICIEG